MTEYQRRATDREMTEIEESFRFCPRYDKHELSDEQIEIIAEKAAKRGVEMAREDFYKDIGHTVVSKWLVIVGMITVSVVLWLRSKNIL